MRSNGLRQPGKRGGWAIIRLSSPTLYVGTMIEPCSDLSRATPFSRCGTPLLHFSSAAAGIPHLQLHLPGRTATYQRATRTPRALTAVILGVNHYQRMKLVVQRNLLPGPPKGILHKGT